MSNLKGHPKGLYLIFATGTAERFSYYGMRAIFILFLIQALRFDKELASSIYGNYTGLVYLTPLIGGYVADKFWGIRRSVFWGAMMMGVGQFFMFLSASMLHNVQLSHGLMYAGLGFIIFGNGFFKPTITTLVGQLYEPNDERLDTAYTIFYMGVNVGAFFAPLVCGYFGETGNPEDFKWGFLIAAISIIVCLILFETQKNKYLVSPSGEPIGVIPDAKKDKEAKRETAVPAAPQMNNQLTKIVLFSGLGVALFILFKWVMVMGWIDAGIFASCIAIPAYILFDGSLTKIERDRILVIYIIAFFVIFFWAAYEQAGASLTIFASEQTQRGFDVSWLMMHLWYPFLHLLGALGDIQYNVFMLRAEEFGVVWEMPASWIQSFNPLFVVLLAFVMPPFWAFLNRKGMEPASPTKQAIGLFLLSIGYLVIAFGVRGMEPGMKASLLWLVALYFIHTVGEMALSPIGLSMVNRLTPVRFASLMMGIWYLSTATANNFAGILSGLYPEVGKEKHLFGFHIETMYDFFMVFVIMSGIASIILFLLSKKLQKMMHGLE